MRIDSAVTTRDAHERRAALRDDLLRCGRRIGWSPHTTIAFTEGLARRPWKRCDLAHLAAALDELQTIEAHRRPTADPRSLAPVGTGRHRKGHRHASRL